MNVFDCLATCLRHDQRFRVHRNTDKCEHNKLKCDVKVSHLLFDRYGLFELASVNRINTVMFSLWLKYIQPV